MLRFILAPQEHNYCQQQFQYIPCYGLSLHWHCRPTSRQQFQYIPCYGLSAFMYASVNKLPSFQYIPCYGLSWAVRTATSGAWLISIHPMLRFIIIGPASAVIAADFNTSHVTVYHVPFGYVKLLIQFQYIPCYGLSHYVSCTSPNIPQFQYIPCYGLSSTSTVNV